VIGLELGADNYVIKPFRMRELVARVRAMLDKNKHAVTVNHTEIRLTRSVFELLAILMGTPGRAFSRLELLEKLQGSALEGTEKTINVHIRNLRTKIEPDPTAPIYIETVFGIGYRFASE